MSGPGTVVGLHGVGVQTTPSTPVSRRDAPGRERSRRDAGRHPLAWSDALLIQESAP